MIAILVRYFLDSYWIDKFIPSSTCGVYEQSSTKSNGNGVTTLTLILFAIGVFPTFAGFDEDCFPS
jgi:hypothetical protein